MIEVRLSHQLPLLVPFVGDHVDIDVSQRSMVRAQPSSDEAASGT